MYCFVEPARLPKGGPGTGALATQHIEHALAPWADDVDPARRAAVRQLVRDLAVVVSAESLFTLTDLCGLSPDDAVASLVSTARRVTATAVPTLRAHEQSPVHPAEPPNG